MRLIQLFGTALIITGMLKMSELTKGLTNPFLGCAY